MGGSMSHLPRAAHYSCTRCDSKSFVAAAKASRSYRRAYLAIRSAEGVMGGSSKFFRPTSSAVWNGRTGFPALREVQYHHNCDACRPARTVSKECGDHAL